MDTTTATKLIIASNSIFTLTPTLLVLPRFVALSKYFRASHSISNSSFFTAQNPNLTTRLSSSSSSLKSHSSLHASSSIGAPEKDMEGCSSGVVGNTDLLIVGAGALGRLVAKKWREEHPGSQIYGQTRTTDHHDELIKMGIKPSLKEVKPAHQFPYVIFCAPPSRTPDYPGDVRQAVLNWNGEGSFLFTSSSAPFDCFDNGQCDEDSPVVLIGRSPRTDVLLKAEAVVLEFGGTVLRLAGLYKEDTGPHIYWLNKGTVEARPDHFLNLIHYEDAASLSVAIMKKKFKSQIFLGCDNHPLSRQEIMELVEKSGKFSKKFDRFTGTSDPLGKKLNNSKTREAIGWEPKYSSFSQFLGLHD